MITRLDVENEILQMAAHYHNHCADMTRDPELKKKYDKAFSKAMKTIDDYAAKRDKK